MRKVAVITTGRWDYGHLFYVMKAIEASNSLELGVVFPLSHQNRQEIVKEFSNKSYMACNVEDIEDYGQFYGAVLKIFQYAYRPELVIVLGDRFEMHAAAMAAKLLNIPIAHLHGGEDTKGSFDNEIRNSVTMLADYHFTSHDSYSRNVMNMKHYNYSQGQGLYDCKVFTVGSPGLAHIDFSELKTREQLEQDFFLDFDKPFLLVSFHPVTKELDNTIYYIVNLLNALYRWGEQAIIVMPNIDPMNGLIKEQIYKAAAVALDKWQVCSSIDHVTFLSLMQHAHMMVGNSSSGIIEAAEFNLPVLNIGTRQDGRIKPQNVFDCSYNEEEIFRHLSSMNHLKEYYKAHNVKIENPYRQGINPAKEIVRILEKELGFTPVQNCSACGTESGD